MKKSLLILIIAISLYGCSKTATPAPVKVNSTTWISGKWIRSALTDTTYIGSNSAVKSFDVTQSAVTLDFTKDISGLIDNAGSLSSFNYSLSLMNITLPNGLWKITKVSDTKFYLTSHINNVGWYDEYTKSN